MAAVLWQGTEAAAPVRSSGQTAVVNVEAQQEDLLPPCTGSIFFTLLFFIIIFFYIESTLLCNQLTSPSSILPTSKRQESQPNSSYISMGFITNCHPSCKTKQLGGKKGTKSQFLELTFSPLKGEKAAVRGCVGRSCRHCRLTSLLTMREVT